MQKKYISVSFAIPVKCQITAVNCWYHISRRMRPTKKKKKKKWGRLGTYIFVWHCYCKVLLICKRLFCGIASFSFFFYPLIWRAHILSAVDSAWCITGIGSLSLIHGYSPSLIHHRNGTSFILSVPHHDMLFESHWKILSKFEISFTIKLKTIIKVFSSSFL